MGNLMIPVICLWFHKNTALLHKNVVLLRVIKTNISLLFIFQKSEVFDKSYVVRGTGFVFSACIDFKKFNNNL